MENLKELFKHPGWQEYLDEVQAHMLNLFRQMFQLEPHKPESFIKFVELKSRIDQLRDMTYFVERQIVDGENIPDVDDSYGRRFVELLKKLWRS